MPCRLISDRAAKPFLRSLGSFPFTWSGFLFCCCRQYTTLSSNALAFHMLINVEFHFVTRVNDNRVVMKIDLIIPTGGPMNIFSAFGFSIAPTPGRHSVQQNDSHDNQVETTEGNSEIHWLHPMKDFVRETKRTLHMSVVN